MTEAPDGERAATPELFVLVHSPSVGPFTWAAVADELHHRDIDVVVPSLRAVATAAPPSGPVIVECIRAALASPVQGRPLTVALRHLA